MLFYTRSQQIKDNACQAIQGLNGTWKIQITQPRRTLNQNDYFHALLAEIAPYTPFPAAELKELLKADFIGLETKVWRGKEYTVPIPSASLDKAQYSLLIEKVLMLADELGVKLKDKGYYGIQ